MGEEGEKEEAEEGMGGEDGGCDSREWRRDAQMAVWYSMMRGMGQWRGVVEARQEGV